MGAKSRPLSDRSGRRDTQSTGTVYRVARREVQTASPEAQTASPVPRASKLPSYTQWELEHHFF